MEEITIKDGKVVVIDADVLRIRNGLELFADSQGFTTADFVNLVSGSENKAVRLRAIAEVVNDSELTEKQRLYYIGKLSGAKAEQTAPGN